MVSISSAPSFGNFEQKYSIRAFDKIPVSEYVSKATGLTVILADIEGPIVNGYFALATEAFDDDGLPHTLEHLVFLGSEHYPFKGVLDLLANRCIASGTNAWTDTDHTCYTVETAGSDGFLSLLPIYLEHILYPTLADEAFVTEVHHITPEGGDAGVVYCEMQGRENAAETRLRSAILKTLYPGHCGYSSETGGIMKNLRESTTNCKVRDFHKSFYRPENLKVIISGKVRPEEVFASLAAFEAQIISKGPRPNFERPWQCAIPDVSEPVELEVKYPADEETNGIFAAAWRGPSIVNEYYTVQALQFVLKYLTAFPTSPLPKEFVEVEDPYASNISYNIDEFSESSHYIIFEDVPVVKLGDIGLQLKSKLKQIVDTSDIDLVQLHSILHKDKLETLSNVENAPHKIISTLIIKHMIYGNNQADLEQRVNPLNNLTKLLDEPKSFWVDLIDKYFVNNQKSIYVSCRPSIEEQQTMARQEKERLEKQIETLTPAGLEEKKQLLENSIAHNERAPPNEMLNSVPVPGTESIGFHSIERFNSDSESKEKIDLSNTPIFTYFDHLDTNFVYIFSAMDTTAVPSDLKLYIPLFLKAILETSVERDGEVVPYEEVVAQLNDDLLLNATSLGISGDGGFSTGNFSSTACLILQVEAAKYEIGFKWLRELMYKTVFSSERLKILISKINNSVAAVKRDGSYVVDYIMTGLRFTEGSNNVKSGVLQQNKFLTDILAKLETGNGNVVIENLEKVRKILTDPANVVLYVATNINLVTNPTKAIHEFLPTGLIDIIKQEKLNVTPDYELLKDPSTNIPGCIVGMGSLESSHFIQTTPSIKSMNDPDLPALKLYLNYLGQLEGPLWKNIRGKGFAYAYVLSVNPAKGLLQLQFYRATNVIGAYKETKSIVDKQLREKHWDESLLASARSSLIFDVIKEEKAVSNVVSTSFSCNFYGIEGSYNKELLKAINNVTEEDLNRVGEKYLAPLFNPATIKTAIVGDPSKIDEIAASFKELGLELHVYTSLENSFLNNI